MELSLDLPGDHLFIRGYSDDRVTVVEDEYSLPLVLTATALYTDWLPEKFDDLDEQTIEKLCATQPEIVLIGSGQRQAFLAPRLQAAFYQRGVGVEVMTVDAACRTFNVLTSESRVVLAALMLNP